MIKFVIVTSLDPGDLVLDCFYGSGPTLQATQGLGRNWIGIDKSEEAARVTKNDYLK